MKPSASTLLVGAAAGAAILAGLFWSFQAVRSARAIELPVLGRIESLSLTNQQGARVTLDDLLGKVWIADIIFTRCAGPCPKLSARFQEIQDRTRGEGLPVLVSLTADPVYDTPETLERYGRRFEADSERWHFLTGEREEINRVAVNEMKLAVVENPEAAPIGERFIHSTKWVVVDREGRVRAYLDGLEDGAVEEAVRAAQALVEGD